MRISGEPNTTGCVPWFCSSPPRMESTPATMVPTFARLSTKSMAANSGPATPRERIMVVRKVSTERLPP